jgi:spermidine synthase
MDRSNPSGLSRPLLFSALTLTTCGILLLELTLTRLFSVILWYHFAFMAISLALFGSAASGIAVYLLRDRLARRSLAALCCLSLLGFSGSLTAGLAVLLGQNLQPTVSWDGLRSLLLVYGLTALPFFFGGAAISMLISTLSEDISRVYFFDLVGASLGCLLVIPLIGWLGGVNAVLAIAALGAAAALLFALASGHRVLALTALLAAGASVCGLTWNTRSPWLEIRYAKGVAERPDRLITRWNSFSRIAVSKEASSPESPRFFSWGISQTYRGPKPVLRGVNIDAMAGTPITRYTGKPEEIEYLRHDITSLALFLTERPRVLAIGPGGGRDILAALAFDAQKITAVELNAVIVDFVQDTFGDFSGRPYSLPGVEAHIDEGRAFIRRTRDRYDLIQASLVDTWAATSAGAYTLSENALYTVEAFEDYFAHLAPGGILTMSRFYTEPPGQMLRLVSLAAEAFKRSGVTDLRRHVLIARTPYYRDPKAFIATAVFGREPFTEDQIQTFHEVCAAERYRIVYSPQGPNEALFQQFVEGDRAALLQDYPYDISPTTDDRPFFFNMLRPQHFLRVFRLSHHEGGFNLDAVFILIAILLVSTCMVGLFVIGPQIADALVRRARPLGLARAIIYFGCLGLGFILVEISLVQKYILLLGHPIYSLVVILFSLLLASSLGSALTRRVAAAGEARVARLAIGGLVLLGLVELALHPGLFSRLVTAPIHLKAVAVVGFVFPMGLLMGMPLPLGVRLAGRLDGRVIPWAWSINGATSVLGTTAAFCIAMNFGFTSAMLVGLSLYLGAGVVLLNRKQDLAPAPSGRETASLIRTPTSEAQV